MKKILFSIVFITLIFTACENNSKKAVDEDSFTETDLDILVDVENDGQTDVEIDEDSVDPDDDSVSDDMTDENPDDDTTVPECLVAGQVFSETGDYTDLTALLFICGNDEAVGTTEVDENGEYTIEYNLVEDVSYCIEAGNWKGCFTAGEQKHVALSANPMTSLVAILSDNDCSDLTEKEVVVRKYLKVGTGQWLTELEYDEMTGVQEGFAAVKALESTTTSEGLIGKVVDDISAGVNAKYSDLFNGFEALLTPEERVIEDTTDPIFAYLAGNSLIVNPAFSIIWTVMNSEIENATADVWSDNPGEHVVKAELIYDSNVIGETYVTATFYTVEKEGDIDVSDLSANMSYWVNDGAVAVFAAGTEIKNGSTDLEVIGYRLLSTQTGSNMTKIQFTPSGTVFSGDPIMIIVDMSTVFSGDPIMLGVERLDEGGEMTALTQASGDPIMLTASGDPIMFTSSGDPIMNIASGDPIMQTDMTNVLVTTSWHFSDISINKKSMPVNVSDLLDIWTTDDYPEGSPFQFIADSIDLGMLTLKNLFADRSSAGEIEAELEKLFNAMIGNVRNIDLFENFYFVRSISEKMKNKKTGTSMSRYAAVYKGYDVKNFLYDAYIKNMSGDRNVALDDVFDLSMLPKTFSLLNRDSRVDLRDRAAQAFLKLSSSDLKKHYILAKNNAKELLSFVNAGKGPAFNNLNGVLDADTVLCMWLSDKTTVVDCKSSPVSFSIGDNGRVTIDGTEVTLAHIKMIFGEHLKQLPDTMPDWKKHELFKSLYLTLKYMTAFYDNSAKMVLFIEGIEKTVGQMFEGLEDMVEEIKIADNFTKNVPTVSVMKGVESLEVPVFGAMFDMLGMIDIVVPDSFNDSWKFKNSTVKMHGYGYVAAGENAGERPGFKINNDLGIKSFVLKDIDFTEFEQDGDGNRVANLAQLFAAESMEVFGECYVEISIVNFFTINGKEVVRERNFKANIADSAETLYGVKVNAPSGKIYINITENMGEGTSLPDAGVSVEPLNRIIFLGDRTYGAIDDLPPAFYKVQAFADGFYPMTKSVMLNSGEIINIDFFLNPVKTETEKGTLSISFSQTTDGGGTSSLISSQLLDVVLEDYNDNLFQEKNGVDGSLAVVFTNVPYGQYTLKVFGESFYPFIESVVVDYSTNERYFTLLKQNTCGNKVVEIGEECDGGMETGYSNVTCGEMFPGSTYPDNFVYCSYECGWDSASCY